MVLDFNKLIKNEEVYEHEIICWNCGSRTKEEIPKGKEIESFVDETVCHNCGCNRRLK